MIDAVVYTCQHTDEMYRAEINAPGALSSLRVIMRIHPKHLSEILQDSGKPLSEKSIHQLCRDLQIDSSSDYIQFLRQFNGAACPDYIVGGNEINLQVLYGYDDGYGDSDLLSAARDMIDLGPEFLPIGFSDLGYTLLIGRGPLNRGRVFWHTELDASYMGGERIQLVAGSLPAFLGMLLRDVPDEDRDESLPEPFEWIRTGRVDLVHQMSDSDIVGCRANDGRNLLMWTAFQRWPSILELLCQRSPKLLHEIDRDGESAIFWAVRSGWCDCIKLLCGAGAELSAVNSAGRTPLTLAVELSQHRAAVTSVLAGADIYEKDKVGDTAIDCAGEDDEMIAMLRNAHERSKST